MPDNPSSQQEEIRSFWDRYQQKLHESGVKEPADRWMVIRAEQYIAAHPDRPLTEQGPADVDVYLQGLRPDLEDWRVQQTVDAIRMLFVLTGVDWLERVDWAHWRASARGLGADHPTAAQDVQPIPNRVHAGAPPPRPSPTRGEADGEVPGPSFAEIRLAHQPLLDRAAVAARVRGLALRTEQTYVHWIMRFIGFLGNADPSGLGAAETAAFLEHLTIERKVSASTWNLALNSLVFFYREVCKREDLDLDEFARAKRPRRLPTVLTPGEVALLLSKLTGTRWLMASLLYGTGMRLMECVRLRVQDLDFGSGQIVVRNAKGGQDRVVPLPVRTVEALRAHLARVEELHQTDLAAGLGQVDVPETQRHKFPQATKDWCWQYVFPSGRVSLDPRSGGVRRHHLHENALQKAVHQAARTAGISKRVGTHTLRHSFATHLLASGYDIRTVQERLGHAGVATTMIYKRVLNRGGKGVQSP